MSLLNSSSLRKVICLSSIALLGIILPNCTRKKQDTTVTDKNKTEVNIAKPQPATEIQEPIKKPKEIEGKQTLNKTTTLAVEERTETNKKGKSPETPKKHTVLPQKETAAATQTTKTLPSHFKIYTNLKRILETIKTGETATKDQLIASKAVPDDALKVVKSIRKVSNNELEVKWKSAWMMERISDVKLNDDTVKIKFGQDVVYTSGNAIGIEYNDKVYNDLIIKGDRAYIPSVKEYSWKIGR